MNEWDTTKEQGETATTTLSQEGQLSGYTLATPNSCVPEDDNLQGCFSANVRETSEKQKAVPFAYLHIPGQFAIPTPADFLKSNDFPGSHKVHRKLRSAWVLAGFLPRDASMRALWSDKQNALIPGPGGCLKNLNVSGAFLN